MASGNKSVLEPATVGHSSARIFPGLIYTTVTLPFPQVGAGCGDRIVFSCRVSAIFAVGGCFDVEQREANGQAFAMKRDFRVTFRHGVGVEEMLFEGGGSWELALGLSERVTNRCTEPQCLEWQCLEWQ